MAFSVSDIIDMSWSDLSKMSIEDLKKVSMTLNSAANKRLRRLEQSGLAEWSPAYQATVRAGDGKKGESKDFSVKGLNKKNEIKAEIMRASSFLQAKTSSTKGAKKHKEMLETLVGEPKKKKKTKSSPTEKRGPGRPRKEKEDKMSEAQRKKLFRALDRLREKDAAKVHNIGSDIIIKELRKLQREDKRKSRDRLVEELEEKFPELMEDSEATYVRERQEIENREDQDGQFHPLSPAESIPDAFRDEDEDEEEW